LGIARLKKELVVCGSGGFFNGIFKRASLYMKWVEKYQSVSAVLCFCLFSHTGKQHKQTEKQAKAHKFSVLYRPFQTKLKKYS
jgi:hypothetical protein